jgi:hypothetical protein
MSRFVRAILFAVVTLLPTLAFSQDYGSKFIGEGTTNFRTLQSVFSDIDGLVVGSYEQEGTQFFSRLTKYSYTGATVWKSEALMTGNFQEDVIIRHDDKYVFAGYDGVQIYLFHYTLDGEPIRVDTMANEALPELLVSHLVLYNGQYVLAGQSIDRDGVLRSLLIRASLDGDVTQTYVDSLSYDINGLAIAPDGNLTVLRKWSVDYIDPIDSFDLPSEVYALTMYDTSFNVVWDYLSPPANHAPVLKEDMAMDPVTGNIVLMMNEERTNWYEENRTQRVVMLSPAGEILWEYILEPRDEDNRVVDYSVRNMLFMPNGNLVLAGQKDRTALPALLGWVFCLSPEGDLLWDREYYSNTLPTDQSFFIGRAAFNDIDVLNDTTILVGGNTVRELYYVDSLDRYLRDQDGWLLTLNEHGCITDVCEDLIVTKTDEVELEVVKNWLYPNPVNETITLSSKEVVLAYDVITPSGQIVARGITDNSLIDVQTLNPGLYFLRIGNETLRFIKL